MGFRNTRPSRTILRRVLVIRRYEVDRDTAIDEVTKALDPHSFSAITVIQDEPAEEGWGFGVRVEMGRA
jgi:hypothetical protein